MSDGEFDKEKAVQFVLDFLSEAERKRYKHVRHIEDVGNFSFLKVNGDDTSRLLVRP